MIVAQVDLSFMDRLRDSFVELGAAVGDFVPRMIVALLIIIVGNWIAKFARKWLAKGLDRLGARKLSESAGIEPMLAQAGTSGVALTAQIAYYLVMIVFVQIAAEVLGIDRVTALLDQLIAYLPLVVVAILVLFVAGAVASWAARLVRPFAEQHGMPWIATAVRVGVLVVGGLAALDTLNFAPAVMERIQTTLLEYLPLSVLVAVAVAFGVGGIETAKQWWKKVEPKSN